MQKISVIIPCYNSAKTLKRCLNSVLNQTHKNFELILVDDGSTDDTKRIIDIYRKTDSRIVYLNKVNGGTGSSRNLGLKYATGDYIQFIDSDDDIKENMFEKMLDAAQKTNADIIVCRFSHCCFKQFLMPGEYDLKIKEDFFKFYMDFFTFNVPWNKLFKRHVITQQYNETLKIFEDGLFVLENLKNAGKIILLEDELYNYFDAGKDDRNSLVNKFLQSRFWESKEGYWYKFNKIKPIFDKVLKANGYQNDLLEYARSFDMAFWELIKLIDSGCTQDVCALEMQGIFNERNFIKSVYLRGYDYNGLNMLKTEEFVKKCFNEYRGKTYNNAGFAYFDLVGHFYKIIENEAMQPANTGLEHELIFNGKAVSLI